MLRAGFSRGRELSVNGAKVAGETGINNNVVNCPLGRGAVASDPTGYGGAYPAGSIFVQSWTGHHLA